MAEIKLCRDCRYRLDGDICGHSNSFIPDYVNGKRRRYDCQSERTWATEKGCGPAAKNFEPKQ